MFTALALPHCNMEKPQSLVFLAPTCQKQIIRNNILFRMWTFDAVPYEPVEGQGEDVETGVQPVKEGNLRTYFMLSVALSREAAFHIPRRKSVFHILYKNGAFLRFSG